MSNFSAEKEPVLTSKEKDPLTLKAFFKRAFDISVSLTVLILLSPVFAGIALTIKRDSPGPVFFRGERTGWRGKRFMILKFRTMYEKPESYNGSPITAEGDKRITPYGKFLRDSKLNELPQFWNVLKGEMSLVGPRPEYPDLVEKWPEHLRQEILSVRPGITSPASITYRNEEQLLKGAGFMDDYLKQILPDKLRLDQLYVRNRSIFTDMDILFMTLIVVLPALRKSTIAEERIISGPFYNFFRRVFTWFMIDVIVTMLAVGLSGIVWRISTVINLGIPTYIMFALALAILVSIINTVLGLHRVRWENASPTYVLDLAFSVGLTTLILWAVTRIWLTDPWIPFSMIFLIGMMTFLGLVTVRFQERLLTGLANRWLLLRRGEASFAERMLVVGAGELGELAIWLLQRSAFSHLFGVVGVVDDDARKQDLRILGLKVLGSTKEIPRIVEKYHIGYIVFAISSINEANTQRILETCRQTQAKTIVIPDLVKVLEKSFNEMGIETKNGK